MLSGIVSGALMPRMTDNRRNLCKFITSNLKQKTLLEMMLENYIENEIWETRLQVIMFVLEMKIPMVCVTIRKLLNGVK